ncbi:MAG: 4Fe-4S binding protein [Bacteroidales bacterium]|nr:4Fe-4S binding protein [Bacteroidales bacterium]
MEREIIKIDESLCDGCGLCVPNCHEGAIQVIDGKARLVSELLCDGLGACIGHCPQGAITIEKREAEPYNEISVISEMKDKGLKTVVAHFRHLKDHGESEYLHEGIDYLQKHREGLSFNPDDVLRELGLNVAGVSTSAGHVHNHSQHMHHGGGCPGSKEKVIKHNVENEKYEGHQPSELRHWPVQMHLINPNASYFRGADLLLAADCVAFSKGDFHSRHLRGKALAIACPKLDRNTEIYVEKIKTLVESARVNTITVMMMEVPCCGGLLQMVKEALSKTTVKVPVKKIIVSIEGTILQEEWI